MKYAKFQHRSQDKITKYIALYLEKWSFCWRQQFARVTQKPRVDVSKSHASWKKKQQSNKALQMVMQAYWNLARVYVDSRWCEKKCKVLYRATLNVYKIKRTLTVLVRCSVKVTVYLQKQNCFDKCFLTTIQFLCYAFIPRKNYRKRANNEGEPTDLTFSTGSSLCVFVEVFYVFFTRSMKCIFRS